GRGAEQPLQLVGYPQLEVIAGQLTLGGEPGAGDVAGAGLCAGDVALDGAAHLAPQIRDPAGRGGDAEEIGDGPRAAPSRSTGSARARCATAPSPAAAAAARALRRGIDLGGWKKPGTGLGDDCLGL